MRVLFDINVVLDLLLEREPWIGDARKLTVAVLDGRIDGFVAAVSFGTIYYVIRKQADEKIAWTCLDRCLATFHIAMADAEVIRSSLELRGSDFEDDLQIASAAAIEADLIVTRDREGFLRSKVTAVDPAEALRWLAIT